MFRLFDTLPDEQVLKVFDETSRQDQAKLAQVDQRFNEISKDKSLELEKYKQKCTVHSVGYTHLVFRKTENHEYYHSISIPFRLYAMQGNKELFGHGMFISQKSYNKCVEALTGNTLSLIEKLKSWGSTADKNAELIKKAFEEENRATLKIK